MSLLLVGQTTLLSQLHMEDYIPRESIVISTDYPSSFHTSRHHVTTTDITFGQNGWERMFEIHDFDRVLYLSGLLDPLGGEPRETAQLFETLLYAGQRGVKHFYICLPDMKAEADGSRRRGYAEGLKNVASLFSSREGFDIKILYVPYIANPDDRNNLSCRSGTRSHCGEDCRG